jgi:hypothetical protein
MVVSPFVAWSLQRIHQTYRFLIAEKLQKKVYTNSVGPEISEGAFSVELKNEVIWRMSYRP